MGRSDRGELIPVTRTGPTMTAMSVPRDTEPRKLGLLSVVAPVYNEEALIEEFYTRVCAALEGVRFELVLVDDGSTDDSVAELERLASDDPRGRVVFLAR